MIDKNDPTLFTSHSETSSLGMIRIVGEASATHETWKKQFDHLALDENAVGGIMNSFDNPGSEIIDTKID